MKISTLALIRLLVNNGNVFCIEKVSRLEPKNIIRFVIQDGYPDMTPFFILDKTLSTELTTDKIICSGNVLCYYDMDTSSVIAICTGWKNLIEEAKKQAITNYPILAT